MEITQIRIFPSKGNNQVKAFVNVIFNDCLCIRGMRIIDGENGLFISMPNHKISDDKYTDYFHPTNPEFKKTLQDAILAEYNKQSN